MLSLRADFPIFDAHPNLVYLDSAASAQKPREVIEAVNHVYRKAYANVHRGVYPLAESTTEAFEHTREIVARFIQASDPSEIVFTKSATESLNLLASSLSATWQAGQNLVLSRDAHHANLVPWQVAAEQHGVELRFADSAETGEIDLDHLESLIDPQTAVVSLTHISNVFGVITPLSEVKKNIEQQGSQAIFVADCCQSAPHLPLSVQELGLDFLVFSSHKVYGPSGVGVLWGRKQLLQQLPPYQTGGDMISSVTLEKSTWNEVPWKFEAGTPNIEGVIGLGAALEYVRHIGMDDIAHHTGELAVLLRDRIEGIAGIKILGEPAPESGIISFTFKDVHPHDIAESLGEQEICIRAGQHCAAPLHHALNIPASSRISLGIYNSESDIDQAAKALEKVIHLFSRV